MTNQLTPPQKIKWAILTKAIEEGDVSRSALKDVPCETLHTVIDAIYFQHVTNEGIGYHLEKEFREGQWETDIPPDHALELDLLYYEKKSVAAQMPDGTYVGWTYWYGGGKDAEPESISWIPYAYSVTIKDEEVSIVQRTFHKAIQSKAEPSPI